MSVDTQAMELKVELTHGELDVWTINSRATANESRSKDHSRTNVSANDRYIYDR